jgi:hypothetical protein
METIGAEDLYEQLNAHERRRLYFLVIALNKSEPEAAIELAERMERFVTSKRFASGDQVDDEAAEASDAGESAADNEAAAAAVEDLSSALSRVANSNGPALRPLASEPRAAGGATFSVAPTVGARSDPAARKSALDATQRLEFKRAIASGANNDELAARFGLTRRQAHGLRIGFARAKAGGGFAAKRSDDLCNASAEREKQENFLRQRLAQPPTIEDVVRFLRQIGDVVVRNGDNYIVNYSSSLTTQELVMRANRKRAANGKPPFEFSHADAPPAAVNHA